MASLVLRSVATRGLLRRGFSTLPAAVVPLHTVDVKWSAVCLGKYCHKGQSTSLVNCGDDAASVADTLHHVTLTIADGVGGWRAHNVDPGVFARRLVDNIRDAAFAHVDVPSPVQLLRVGFDMLINSREVEAGSSTATVATLNKAAGTLEVANLGDSGACVFRNGQLVFATQSQELFFNAPLQLSALRERGNRLQAEPEDAIVDGCTVQPGDVLLLGTDGLFDNVYTEDLAQLVEVLHDEHSNVSVETVANRVLNVARRNATRRNWKSPFATNAATWGHSFRGGKEDDIALILARLVAA